TGGLRPDDAQVVGPSGGNVLTVWPTKLALVPRLAELILAQLPEADPARRICGPIGADFPRPMVALAPWDAAEQWVRR
ncbi:MAG: hypothetical protein KDA32_15675, partial [Phycisphaerales bacterium]|nr:hypothetical protein [Phycisphaerales bacterium]